MVEIKFLILTTIIKTRWELTQLIALSLQVQSWPSDAQINESSINTSIKKDGKLTTTSFHI